MKNVEAFKKYYANATKEQVIEDMYLDNCNLQQELQRKDNIINELKKWLNEFETKEFNYNFLVVRVKDVLDKIKEIESK